jgi:hypothetical protein
MRNVAGRRRRVTNTMVTVITIASATTRAPAAIPMLRSQLFTA